jgi:8-oxo-dGTP pyrophosphatase MutT (NUDIX family)
VRFDVPPAIAERVRAAAAGPAKEPVPARDAATVVLLRDAPARDGAPGGVETYVLHRVIGMAAFGGLTVFPGGSVDDADVRANHVPWAGPPPQWWCTPLSASADLARALVVAAVRETFEESGVLLAGSATGDAVLADITDDTWELARQGVEAHRISMHTLLSERGLALRADLLRPWAHWVTPVLEQRRYDTRFFVAALPPGQTARDVSTEAARAGWARPADLLAARERGEVQMVPPTALTLAELAQQESVAGVLAAAERRTIRPVTPGLRVETDGRVTFHLPDDVIPEHLR